MQNRSSSQPRSIESSLKAMLSAIKALGIIPTCLGTQNVLETCLLEIGLQIWCSWFLFVCFQMVLVVVWWRSGTSKKKPRKVRDDALLWLSLLFHSILFRLYTLCKHKLSVLICIWETTNNHTGFPKRQPHQHKVFLQNTPCTLTNTWTQCEILK